MKKMWLAAVAALCLAACSQDPMIGVHERLAAKDYPGAKTLLVELVRARPELAEPHAQLFVLYRWDLVQGDAAQHDADLKGCVREYEWLADHFSLNKDYTQMEESLKKNEASRPTFQAAYDRLYGGKP